MLTAIEYALQGADEATLKKSAHLAPLLRSLAYDSVQFEHAVGLLIKLAQVTNMDEARDGEPAGILTSLFPIVLSGTHAPVAMRLKVLRGLLQSDDAGLRAIGVTALEAMLKTDHFFSSYGFEFGARSRDYGYHPRTGKDVQEWFDAVMAMASPLALSESPVAPEVRTCIASGFRGLWANAGQANALESLAKQIVAKGFWREGWIAARRTKVLDGKRMSADVLAQLTALEELLRPNGLVDRARVLAGLDGGSIDLDDIEEVEGEDFAGAAARMNAAVENLGREVAADDDAFKTLLPSLIRGGSRVRAFGEGLASNTEKPYELWQAFLTEFAAADRANTSVIGGFVNGVQRRDAGLADKLLNEALEHPSVGACLPELQASVTIDWPGVKRLHRALDLGIAPISQFYSLAYGQASDNIPGAAFRDLLLAIARKSGGDIVALEILSMRLFSDASHKRQFAPEVIEVGRALLEAYEFRKRDGRADQDRELGRIVQVSLQGADGIPIVRRMVRDMMAAINRHDIYAHNQDDLMVGLLRVHPTVVLDEMYSGDAKARTKAAQVFVDLLKFHNSPLDVVPDETLLQWCGGDPAARYALIAASATLFRCPADGKPEEWTPLASKLLAKAPDTRAVFRAIVRRLDPSSWSGSRATELESRLKVLERLPLGDTPGFTEAFQEARVLLQERIADERKREAEESRSRNERFE